MVALPDPDAEERDGLLFRQDGVISRRQTLEVMPEALLRRLVATGRWSRPHRGIHLTHNGVPSPNQRRMS